MPQHDEKHVKVCGCMIVWDAMTRPDTNESGTKHNFKVIVPPNNPDIQLLDQLANKTLMESVFKGTLPEKGTMPVGTLGPNEYNGQFNGWRVFTSGTYRGFPQCFDENGAVLDPMQAGPLIYTGQIVDLLVHCYANNGIVKGIACGLDGFSIIVSANAQRQNFGSAGVDASGAFGGGQPAQQQPAQYQPPAQGQPAQQQPAQYQPPAQGQPAQQQPAQYQPPAQGQPAQDGQQQPQQAHDFLPNNGGQQSPQQ